MRSKFVSELQAMHEDLIQMASLAETAISSSVKALETMDETLAQKVVGSDHQIDELEKEVERRCLRLLLQQQPVARDLRSVSTALKMITDLERIGDQAADIAEVTVFLCRNRDFQMPEGLREMALAAVKMVRGAIDAFVEENLDKAHEVIGYDDVVDRAFLRTRDELIRQVKQATGSAEQIMDLLMIAKYLERIGDHAVNTAEWVVFFLTGAHKDAQVI
ncbi:MAG: phosphate signaling complex protein PhoU [Butyricicoccus sp.]|jgi:phosphate transport system protein|nr:phosphate signaling complex protein PhoU [Clostridiales bacterium]